MSHDRLSPHRVQKTFAHRADAFARVRKTFWCETGQDNRIKAISRARLHSLDDRGYPTFGDFGGGNGHFAESLIPVMKSGGYIALVDNAFEMLQEAESRLTKLTAARRIDLRLVCTSASRTPFPANAFDLTTAKMLLHHVGDPFSVLCEMGRVTKPGGSVLALVPGSLYQSAFKVGRGPWRDAGFPAKATQGNGDCLGRYSEEELGKIAVHVPQLEVDRIHSDYCVYGFRNFRLYLEFMNAVGADAKLRNYKDDMAVTWQPYAGLFSEGEEVRLRVNFLCLEAHKAFAAEAEQNVRVS